MPFELSARFLKSASASAAAIGFLAASFSVLALVSSGFDSLLFERPTDSEQNDRISIVEQRLELVQSDVYAEGEPVSEMDSSRVLAIEERQQALDEALSENTDRVIALASMRKDLDDLDDEHARQVEGLERQVSELRTILLGIAGSLIAVLLAAVSWLGLRKATQD